MKVFIISRDGEEVERESVSDCNSVEQYMNRKFGSCKLDGLNIEVKMVTPVAPKKEEAKPVAPVKPAPKAVGVPVTPPAEPAK